MLLLLKFQDVDDCAKMFICQLSTKPKKNLDDIEQNISSIFGTNEQGALDATKPSVLFNLATTVDLNNVKLFMQDAKCHMMKCFNL